MTHDPEAHTMNLLFPLLLTALASAVLEFLLPGGDGSNSRMQGPIRTVVGLCILVALISPVREGISLLRHLAVSDATQLTEQFQSSYPGIIQPARSAEEYADQIRELKDFEQVLVQMASQRLSIDLDDGVRVNYPKFYPLVEPIKGLDKE